MPYTTQRRPIDDDWDFDVDVPYAGQRQRPQQQQTSNAGASRLPKVLASIKNTITDKLPRGRSTPPAPGNQGVPASTSQFPGARIPGPPTATRPVKSSSVSPARQSRFAHPSAVQFEARQAADDLATSRFLASAAKTIDPLRDELRKLQGQVSQLNKDFGALQQESKLISRSNSTTAAEGHAHRAPSDVAVRAEQDDFLSQVFGSCFGFGDAEATESSPPRRHPPQGPAPVVPMPQPLIRQRPRPEVQDELEQASPAAPSPTQPSSAASEPPTESPASSAPNSPNRRHGCGGDLQPDQEKSPERLRMNSSIGTDVESPASTASTACPNGTSSGSAWKIHPVTGNKYELPFPEADSFDHDEACKDDDDVPHGTVKDAVASVSQTGVAENGSNKYPPDDIGDGQDRSGAHARVYHGNLASDAGVRHGPVGYPAGVGFENVGVHYGNAGVYLGFNAYGKAGCNRFDFNAPNTNAGNPGMYTAGYPANYPHGFVVPAWANSGHSAKHAHGHHAFALPNFGEGR